MAIAHATPGTRRLSHTQIAGQGFGDPEECAYVPAPKRVPALLGKRGFK